MINQLGFLTVKWTINNKKCFFIGNVFDKIKMVNDMKKNFSKILSIIGVLLIVIGVVLSFVDKLSPKTIIKHEINKTFEALKTEIKHINDTDFKYDFEKDALGINGKLAIEMGFSGPNNTNSTSNYELSYNGAIDQKGNNANLNLLLNSANQNILDVKGYIEGNILKLDTGDIFDKVISFGLSKELKDYNLNSYNTDNYVLLLDKTRNLTENFIDEQKEKTTKVGKETKTIYTIKENDFYVYLYNGYLNDKEVLNVLSNIKGETVEETRKSLTREIEYQKKEEYSDKFVISVVKEGLSCKGIEIEIHSPLYFENKEEVTTVSITPDKDVYKFVISTDGKKVGHGEYSVAKKELTYESDSEFDYSKMSLSWNDETFKLNYSLSGMEYSGKSSIDLVVKTKTTDTGRTINVNLDFETMIGDEVETMKINSENTISKNAKVVPLESAKSIVSSNEITEPETAAIMNKIKEKYMSLFGLSTTSDTYFRKIFNN